MIQDGIMMKYAGYHIVMLSNIYLCNMGQMMYMWYFNGTNGSIKLDPSETGPSADMSHSNTNTTNIHRKSYRK